MPNIGTNYTSHRVSTQVQQGSPYFGKSTITVVYRVNWTGATTPGSPPPGIDLPYGLDLVLAEAGVLPKIDTAYPAPGSGSSTWQQTALVRSITAVPQQQYIDVNVVYDTMYFYSATAKKNVSGTVSAAAADVYLPARTVYQSARRSANAWRGNWATNPPAGSDSTTDIGGSMISAGKTPQRIDVAQMKIRMKLLVDTAIQTPTDITAAAIAYVGKRNSDVFLGWPAGSLVCDSASLTQVDHEFFELSMEYTWDEWNHHNQTPETAPDGVSIKMASPTDVFAVFWKRENRASVAFNDIFGTGDAAGVWRYMAENGVYY